MNEQDRSTFTCAEKFGCAIPFTIIIVLVFLALMVGPRLFLGLTVLVFAFISPETKITMLLYFGMATIAYVIWMAHAVITTSMSRWRQNR